MAADPLGHPNVFRSDTVTWLLKRFQFVFVILTFMTNKSPCWGCTGPFGSPRGSAAKNRPCQSIFHRKISGFKKKINPIGVRMAILQKMTPPWVCTYPSDIVSIARYDIASLYLQQPENANPPPPQNLPKIRDVFIASPTLFLTIALVGPVAAKCGFPP